MSLFKEFMNVHDILEEGDDDSVYAIVMDDNGKDKLLAVYKNELGAEKAWEGCMNDTKWENSEVKEYSKDDIKRMKYHGDANLFRKKYTLFDDVSEKLMEEKSLNDYKPEIEKIVNEYFSNIEKGLVNITFDKEVNDVTIGSNDPEDWVPSKKELLGLSHKFDHNKYSTAIHSNIKVDDDLTTNVLQVEVIGLDESEENTTDDTILYSKYKKYKMGDKVKVKESDIVGDVQGIVIDKSVLDNSEVIVNENSYHVDSLEFYEDKTYTIKHNTYSSAVDAAIKYAKESGYELNDDEVFQITGIENSKPKDGKTVRMTIPLYKNDKEVKKALQVQITDLDGEFYELNCYIL